MPNAAANLIFLKVLGTKFKSYWRSTLLPVGVLKARVIVFSVIQLGTYSCFFEHLEHFLSLTIDCHCIVASFDDWNHDYLHLGYFWRKNEAHVVRVDHNHGANTPSGQAPRGLPNVLLLSILVLIPDFEHL